MYISYKNESVPYSFTLFYYSLEYQNIRYIFSTAIFLNTYTSNSAILTCFHCRLCIYNRRYMHIHTALIITTDETPKQMNIRKRKSLTLLWIHEWQSGEFGSVEIYLQRPMNYATAHSFRPCGCLRVHVMITIIIEWWYYTMTVIFFRDRATVGSVFGVDHSQLFVKFRNTGTTSIINCVPEVLYHVFFCTFTPEVVVKYIHLYVYQRSYLNNGEHLNYRYSRVMAQIYTQVFYTSFIL